MAFLDMLLLHIYQLQYGVSIIVYALRNQKIHSFVLYSNIPIPAASGTKPTLSLRLPRLVGIYIAEFIQSSYSDPGKQMFLSPSLRMGKLILREVECLLKVTQLVNRAGFQTYSFLL